MTIRRIHTVAVQLAGAALACLSLAAAAAEHQLTLNGASEVPAVTTQAAGSGTVTIGDDRSVRASIRTTGMNATAAHIHMGAAGANGPVIVPFKKDGDAWVPANATARLTDDQYAAYKAGNLYVNVHSAAHPGGEIRAQIKP